MTLDDFGNLLECFHYRLELGGVVEENTYVCASLISYGFGIDEAFGTGDYTAGIHTLNALMDCRSRYAAFAGYFEIWLSGIT